MLRRELFRRGWTAALSWLATGGAPKQPPGARPRGGAQREHEHEPVERARELRLFLCGDVMTGRGVDQVLPHPSDPVLYETWAKDARRYVELAEAAHGPVGAPVGLSYVWGDALAELERAAPDLRIVNLETAVTSTTTPWPDKGIHYRMHPANAPCLSAAGIDCCVLANNHVLDWGRPGLLETLETLARAGIATAGAGRDREEAEAPAVLEAPGKGRVLVYGFGCSSSGIPRQWAAERRPGVNLLPDLSPQTARRLGERVRAARRAGDLVVASIHWGGNWGYEVSAAERAFARLLIDEAAVDVVHGHSAHHAKGIEVHEGRPILYGCGDYLTDYEGIAGYESYRDDLAVMYLPTLDARTGRLSSFEMVPLQIRNFRLNRPSAADVRWLRDTLDRECARLGARVELVEEGRLALRW
jgi:poly-gamma-glutamate capsule biosynthesis protein CapA/YwtB (metallophosphatase superfamily)